MGRRIRKGRPRSSRCGWRSCVSVHLMGADRGFLRRKRQIRRHGNRRGSRHCSQRNEEYLVVRQAELRRTAPSGRHRTEACKSHRRRIPISRRNTQALPKIPSVARALQAKKARVGGRGHDGHKRLLSMGRETHVACVDRSIRRQNSRRRRDRGRRHMRQSGKNRGVGSGHAAQVSVSTTYTDTVAANRALHMEERIRSRTSRERTTRRSRRD